MRAIPQIPAVVIYSEYESIKLKYSCVSHQIASSKIPFHSTGIVVIGNLRVMNAKSSTNSKFSNVLYCLVKRFGLQRTFSARMHKSLQV